MNLRHISYIRRNASFTRSISNTNIRNASGKKRIRRRNKDANEIKEYIQRIMYNIDTNFLCNIGISFIQFLCLTSMIVNVNSPTR